MKYLMMAFGFVLAVLFFPIYCVHLLLAIVRGKNIKHVSFMDWWAS